MKSKIFAVAAFAFAFSFAFTAAAATALPMGGVTVKAGSPSAYVMGLQTNLNVCAMANPVLVADGAYGPKTTAAVAAFQVANGGLTVDGQAGPKTQAALIAKCSGTTTTTTTTTTSTTLSGGAGDADLTSTGTNVENTVKEGASENVLGFKVEADGSDINVSNVKVSFANQGTGSEKFTNYVDSVSIFHGTKEVGSMDAEDFSRESGSPDTFSKTISLSNAVVEEGDKDAFYVTVEAAGSIDSDDITSSEWVVQLDTVRFNDATGAILSVDGDDDADVADDSSFDETFNFEDESGDDDLSIKSSTANPSAATLTVEEDTTSDEFLVGAFKFDVDEESSEIALLEIPVVLTIDDSANTGTSDDADAIIDTVTVKIGSDEFEADFDADTITNGDGTATYIVDLNDEDVMVDAGEDVEVKIYVTFNDQDTNYGTGTTVVASVDGSDVQAEGADELSSTGSFTGKTHTLSVGVPTVALDATPTLTLSSAVDAGPDVWVAKFVVNVTAPEDQDVFLPLDTFAYGTSGTSGVEYSVTGGATILSAVLEASDSDIEEDDSYLVSEGETEEFTFSVYLQANDASGKVELTSFWYEISDTTPNGTPEITTGLTNFKTPTKFLAE